MDTVRQIRILIPPFFFFAAILLGAHFDTENLVREAIPDVVSTQSLLGVIAAAAVFVLPFGFFIGGITRVSLTAVCWVLSKYFFKQPVWFETCPPDRSGFVKRIWPFLDFSSRKANVGDLFYATVTFDHQVLYGHARGIHEWLVRRWSGFSAAIGSCVSLLLALPASLALKIDWTQWSWWPGIVFIFVLAVLFCTAWRNWLETMRMLAFQSHRDFKNIREASERHSRDSSDP